MTPDQPSREDHAQTVLDLVATGSLGVTLPPERLFVDLRFLYHGLTVLHRRKVVDLAAKYRLPAIYTQREHVESGGLMAYGPSFLELFQRAPIFVDKILKGARPEDLPN
jgi:hypothetical protein